MKFITISKEAVLCELALGNEVFLIDRWRVLSVKAYRTLTDLSRFA